VKTNFYLLKNQTENLKNIVKKLNSIFPSLKQFNELNKNFISLTNNIISGTLSQISTILQISLFSFQIFVSLLNIISTLFVIFPQIGFRRLGKYIGHSSWCLSTINIIILSFIIFTFYCLGVFLMNSHNMLQKLKNDLGWWQKIFDNETPETIDKYFYLTCMNSDNYLNYQKFLGEGETIMSLNMIYSRMIRFNIYDETIDPFYTVKILSVFKNFSDTLFDPYLAFGPEKVGGISPLEDLEKTLNRIIDFKHSFPYQVMNECPIITSVEMFIRQQDCSYPINTNPNITFNDLLNGNICLLLTSLEEKDIERLFYDVLHKCKNNTFLDDGYSSLYEELLTGFKIAKAFYSNYTIFRDGVNDVFLKYFLLNIDTL
jgi:hypothetical protein